MKIEDHLGWLGFKCRDRVSGLRGVVTSISFDLYGCVQAVLHPGLDHKGKIHDSCWFDIARLEKIELTPVMDVPDFNGDSALLIADGKKGPAEKPPC